MKVTFVAALPPAFRGENWQKLGLLNPIRKVARMVKADFQKTTETWEEHDPQFEEHIHLSTTKHEASFDITIGQGAADGPYRSSATDSEVWGYLDKGTKSRHMIMTRDFTPKTSPGTFESVGGSGNAAFLDGDQGPIKARGWTDQERLNLLDWWPRDLQAALADIAKRTGHGG